MSTIEFCDEMYYKDRTTKYRLKDIFDDNWDNFVNDNPNLKIREFFLKVNKMYLYEASALGYSVYECHNCRNFISWQYPSLLEKIYYD